MQRLHLEIKLQKKWPLSSFGNWSFQLLLGDIVAFVMNVKKNFQWKLGHTKQNAAHLWIAIATLMVMMVWGKIEMRGAKAELKQKQLTFEKQGRCRVTWWRWLSGLVNCDIIMMMMTVSKVVVHVKRSFFSPLFNPVIPPVRFWIIKKLCEAFFFPKCSLPSAL